MTMTSTCEQNKVKVATEWINKLANGINQIDGSVLPDNDIVNNIHISRCLFFVADLLDKVGRKDLFSPKKNDVVFNLSPDDLSRIYIAEKSTISMFVKEINKVIPENMKRLKVSSVIKWLLSLGYLDEVEKGDGHRTKVPTDLGRSIGISSEMRVTQNGEYSAVIYDANAQRFILNNLLKE